MDNNTLQYINVIIHIHVIKYDKNALLILLLIWKKFSGVIFALKVLTTHEEPYIRAMLLGVEIPGKYAAWVELIVIHMLVPNSSFMGHFAGILAGIIYCKSFLGPLLDKLLYCITGKCKRYPKISYLKFEKK